MEGSAEGHELTEYAGNAGTPSGWSGCPGKQEAPDLTTVQGVSPAEHGLPTDAVEFQQRRQCKAPQRDFKAPG